jgi:hypothetical protein
MAKHWRRKGGIGEQPVPALTIADIGGDLWEGTLNAAALALPGSSVTFSVRFDGGAWTDIETQAWPHGGTIIDVAGHHGETVQARAVIDGTTTIVSNIGTVAE